METERRLKGIGQIFGTCRQCHLSPQTQVRSQNSVGSHV